MSTMTQLRTRLRQQSTLQVVTGLEAVAIAFTAVARELGCGGSDMQLISRGLAFGLICRVTVCFFDAAGICVGEVCMDFDASRLAMDVDGHRLELDPDQPVTPQISRALGKMVKGARVAFEREGAVRRECQIRFSDDIYRDDDQLARARKIMNVSGAAALDYGPYDRVRAGGVRPGRLASTLFAVFGRGPRKG